MHVASNEQLVVQFYETHHRDLISFVSKGVAYSSVAEDIVQDVYVKMLTADRMISEITLQAFVYTMARNLVADYWRRRVRMVHYEQILQSASAGNMEVKSVYSSSEIIEILERGIVNLLSDRQRQVFCMNVLDDMKIGSIAESLGENYKTVEGRLGTARKIMRGYIKRMLA